MKAILARIKEPSGLAVAAPPANVSFAGVESGEIARPSHRGREARRGGGHPASKCAGGMRWDMSRGKGGVLGVRCSGPMKVPMEKRV